jgi:hypothetical protein
MTAEIVRGRITDEMFLEGRPSWGGAMPHMTQRESGRKHRAAHGAPIPETPPGMGDGITS